MKCFQLNYKHEFCNVWQLLHIQLPSPNPSRRWATKRHRVHFNDRTSFWTDHEFESSATRISGEWGTNPGIKWSEMIFSSDGFKLWLGLVPGLIYKGLTKNLKSLSLIDQHQGKAWSLRSKSLRLDQKCSVRGLICQNWRNSSFKIKNTKKLSNNYFQDYFGLSIVIQTEPFKCNHFD